MWGCFKSEHRKKLERLAERGCYENILQACGYQSVPEFSETLSIMQGPKEMYDRLTKFIATDETGIANAMLLQKIALSTDDLPSITKRVKQGFFVVGIENRAYERGLGELKKSLRGKSLTDPDVLKGIAATQSAEVMEKGYDCAAYSVQASIKSNDVREKYIEREKSRLDQLIASTQTEAMKNVDDRLKADESSARLSANEQIDAVSEERKRLTWPFKQTKKKLGDSFDQNLSAALVLIRQGLIGKSYLLMSSYLGYDGAQHVQEGREAVLRTRTPSWLFTEILKSAYFEREKDINATMWQRDQDSSMMVLAKRWGDTYICETHYDAKKACATALYSLARGDADGYSLITSKLKGLIDQALKR